VLTPSVKPSLALHSAKSSHTALGFSLAQTK
jgi:hypothetical protein